MKEKADGEWKLKKRKQYTDKDMHWLQYTGSFTALWWTDLYTWGHHNKFEQMNKVNMPWWRLKVFAIIKSKNFIYYSCCYS